MSRIVGVGCPLLLIAFASSCVHSNLDESWGRSHDAQLVWQTADPEAPATREPTEGLDPETAQRVAKRYYEGQEKQVQRETQSVLIGEF